MTKRNLQPEFSESLKSCPAMEPAGVWHLNWHRTGTYQVIRSRTEGRLRIGKSRKLGRLRTEPDKEVRGFSVFKTGPFNHSGTHPWP